MHVDDALQELVNGIGTRFDHDVVAHLVHLVQAGEVLPGGAVTPGQPNRRAA
jgi:hypothetical protein